MSNGNSSNFHDSSYEVSLAVGLVMFMLALFFVCFRCIKEEHSEPTRMDNHEESSSIEDGLEGVRDSHPTIVYNNKHEALAHLEERSCSICLDDYKDKETLRVLMGCRHVYHVDCIDAWLERSSSCPICRSSPRCL